MRPGFGATTLAYLKMKMARANNWWLLSDPSVSLNYSHHSHVVLWLQRDLQHFGPVHHPLHTGCGDSLPGDAVDLVKGVRLQELLVRGADVDLEPQLSCALVPTKLVKTNQNASNERSTLNPVLLLKPKK